MNKIILTIATLTALLLTAMFIIPIGYLFVWMFTGNGVSEEYTIRLMIMNLVGMFFAPAWGVVMELLDE